MVNLFGKQRLGCDVGRDFVAHSFESKQIRILLVSCSDGRISRFRVGRLRLRGATGKPPVVTNC